MQLITQEMLSLFPRGATSVASVFWSRFLKNEQLSGHDIINPTEMDKE